MNNSSAESTKVAPENTWRDYQTKPVAVQALQFDPNGAHRDRLPDGVVGVPAPGADNWAYEGCRFFVTVQVGDHVYRSEVKAGDWIIVTDDGNWRTCAKDLFEKGFEPITKSKLLLPKHLR